MVGIMVGMTMGNQQKIRLNLLNINAFCLRIGLNKGVE
jgi:hypothetical protein